jgi:DNA-binding winged helix-turn-helix (wHTH) protein/TolB-like protein
MASHPPVKESYRFGPFQIDTVERVLFRDQEAVPLTPKVSDMLLLLLENAGHVVEKERLMQAIWPNSFVEEGNLTQNISVLRRALGDGENGHQYIQTIARRGYRLVGNVSGATDAIPDLIVEEHSRLSVVVEQEEETIALSKHPEAEPAAHGNSSPPSGDSAVTASGVRWRGIVASRPLMAATVLATLVIAALGYMLFFRPASAAPQPEIKSLAVLPVKSLSKDPDDDYLGLGIADTIILKVSQNGQLTVRPTSAVRKYANQEIDSLEAARQLKVDSVLDGTVQRLGDRLRVNLNLLRTRDGASLWSESFNVSLADLFKMQDEVSQQVVARLRLKLISQERQRIANVRSVNPEATEYYMRAKFHAGLQNRADNDAAIKLLERSVAIDPNFAIAYAGLAMEYWAKGFTISPREREWEEKAFGAAEAALSLAPDLAEAHLAHGLALWTPSKGFPHEGVVQEYRRALGLNPNLVEAHQQLANVYNHIGLLDKASEELQQAIAINPSNTGARYRIGINLLFQGRYEEALAALADSEKFHPSLWAFQTSWVLFQLGKKDEASARIEEALRDDSQDLEGGVLTAMQAIFAAAAGQRHKAVQSIGRAAEIGQGYGHFHHTAYAIASAYALLNEHEQAIRWSQRAADDGFPCYPLFDHDPNLDHLRQDPRFIAFMAKLKEQWEHYRAVL